MEYQQLSQNERDDMIAGAMYGREFEHFGHALNAANFAASLKELPKTPANKELLEKLTTMLREAKEQMAVIDVYYLAVSSQLADPARREAAFTRVALVRERQQEAALKPK